MCKLAVYSKLPVYTCKPAVYTCKLVDYTQAKTVLTFQIIQIIQGGFTKFLLINTAY